MATRNVLFHRLAAGEYRSARDWYAQRSAEVAVIVLAVAHTSRQPGYWRHRK